MKILSLILVVLLAASTVVADDFGCKAILCLTSPGGPKQFEECRPTIEKLQRKLSLGRPFPTCQEAEGTGLTTKNGVEPWEPCAGGYTPAIEEGDMEFGRSNSRVCRKLIGWKEVYSDGEGLRKIPVYDQYDQKSRPEPNYVEAWHDGEQKGERFYYKIKKKKKGWF